MTEDERRHSYSIDPVEFGKLVQGVETLTDGQTAIFRKIDDIEAKMNRGYGILAGVSIAGGGIGAALHKILEKMSG